MSIKPKCRFDQRWAILWWCINYSTLTQLTVYKKYQIVLYYKFIHPVTYEKDEEANYTNLQRADLQWLACNLLSRFCYYTVQPTEDRFNICTYEAVFDPLLCKAYIVCTAVHKPKLIMYNLGGFGGLFLLW